MRYRVELEGLLAFVDTLQAFERDAESIAARVDEHVTGLHESWLGEGAPPVTSHCIRSGRLLRARCEKRWRSCEKPRASHIATTPTPSN